MVLGSESLDEHGDLGADRRASRPVRVGPVPGDQAAMPPQDGAWGDQPVHPQASRQELEQPGEDGAIGPVQPGPGTGTAQYCDLVAQNEQFDVLGRR
jgi:hypothetical protein